MGILFAEKDGVFMLRFEGDVRIACGPTISNFLDRVINCDNFHAVIIDLSDTVAIDSTSLGMIAKIAFYTEEKFNITPTIVSTHEDINRILFSMGFDHIFEIISECNEDCGQLDSLPESILPETVLRKQVIEAHKILIDMNEQNRLLFRDLVAELESEESVQSRVESPQQASC